MGDLRGLMTDVKRLYEAMEQLQARQDAADAASVAEAEDINIQKIWFSAKVRPFRQHVLTKRDSDICKRYLTILSAFTSLLDDKDKRTAQIRFISRILAACSEGSIHIRTVLAEGELITEKSIDEFYEIKDEGLQLCLLTDLFIMCYLDGNPDERQLDFAVGFMALLGLKPDMVNAVGKVVKGVLEQNDELVLTQNRYLDVVNVYCYMKNPPDGVLVSDLEKAKEVEADKIIFYGGSFEAVNEINCNQYKAATVEFRECKFEGIQRIYNTDRQVIFEKCRFSNCQVEHTLLMMKKTIISSCVFSDLSTYNLNKNQFLFVLEDSQIENSIFMNIKLNYDKSSTAFGGMLVGVNLQISKCKFDKISVDAYVANYTVHINNMIKLYGGKIYKCIISNWSLPRHFFAMSLHGGAVQYDMEISNYACENSERWLSDGWDDPEPYKTGFF